MSRRSRADAKRSSRGAPRSGASRERPQNAKPRKRGSYEARSAPIATRDWSTAVASLAKAVRRGGGPFTIGRSVARNLRLLPLRYGSSRKIEILWRGSAGKAVTLERKLQSHACRKYPNRVANQNIGGGRRAPDGPHVLYVALLPAAPPKVTVVESLVGGVRRRTRRRRTACRVASRAQRSRRR